MTKHPSKTILFLSKGQQSASTRYRASNYFDALSEQGWTPKHLTLSSGAGILKKWAILRQVAKADVVVLLRRTISGTFLRLLRHRSKHLVFDFDDAIFCNSDGSTSSLRRKRFETIIACSDTVWAGNDYLAEQAILVNNGKHKRVNSGANKHIIPTVVDVPRYQATVHKTDQFIDCVWIGSSSTRRYLDKLIPVLDELAVEFPQLRLKVIADFNPDTKTIPVIAIPWSEAGETEALASAHIGIAPMIENSWTAGKCGLKVIQYMAAGLPVITDNAGVNKFMVVHDVTGFVADTDTEWKNAIQYLAENPNAAIQMGAAGRLRAEQNYSLQASLKKMLDSLTRLAD